MGTPPRVGIDLLEPERLAERLQRSESLADTLFTRQEREYCEGQLRTQEHFAARFCAKEAVIKALGIDGWDPLDVEIVGGGPDVQVRLHRDVAATAARLGLTVTVSMTHLASLAGAVSARPPDRVSPLSARRRSGAPRRVPPPRALTCSTRGWASTGGSFGSGRSPPPTASPQGSPSRSWVKEWAGAVSKCFKAPSGRL